jgi:uncharacterized coiled-coil protein SlyX
LPAKVPGAPNVDQTIPSPSYKELEQVQQRLSSVAKDLAEQQRNQEGVEVQLNRVNEELNKISMKLSQAAPATNAEPKVDLGKVEARLEKLEERMAAQEWSDVEHNWMFVQVRREALPLHCRARIDSAVITTFSPHKWIRVSYPMTKDSLGNYWMVGYSLESKRLQVTKGWVPIYTEGKGYTVSKARLSLLGPEIPGMTQEPGNGNQDACSLSQPPEINNGEHHLQELRTSSGFTDISNPAEEKNDANAYEEQTNEPMDDRETNQSGQPGDGPPAGKDVEAFPNEPGNLEEETEGQWQVTFNTF